MMVITGRVHCPDTSVSCIYLEIWRRMTLLSKDMAAARSSLVGCCAGLGCH